MFRPQQRSREQKAFGGRVGFHVTYITPATTNLSHRLEERALEGATDLDENQTSAIGNLAWFLAHTTDVVLYDDSHPEIGALGDFWRWWASAWEEMPEPEEFRRMIFSVGVAVQNSWGAAIRACDLDNVGPLAAPTALLPDEHLSDVERADPNSASAGSNSETISGVRSARSRSRKSSRPASTSNPTTGG